MVPSILKTSMGNDGAFWFQAYQKLVWGSMVPNALQICSVVLSIMMAFTMRHCRFKQPQIA